MKFDFTNSNNETLAGKLELPKRTPKAFAIFAHCFTCSKDIIAANIISKKLNDSEIAVLRFDFTGIGNSEGDFSNTNFSSNVQDLIDANNAITEKYQAPTLIIGHSLGGAAVLKAATLLDNIKAVVTIGAPSCTGHVAHLFKQGLSQIEEQGEAEILLAGRSFKIKKQFIDDINEVDVLNGVRNFNKALLVMHSPLDDTVSIEHAGNIFQAAKHPKSFISLDKADHLLMKKDDANYVANLIGTWSQKFVI